MRKLKVSPSRVSGGSPYLKITKAEVVMNGITISSVNLEAKSFGIIPRPVSYDATNWQVNVLGDYSLGEPTIHEIYLAKYPSPNQITVSYGGHS